MKIYVTMHMLRECQGSYRYQADERSDFVHSLYIRKEAFRNGAKVPKSILVTVGGLEE